METFSIEYALLSMQSALLDVITPDLRAVDINVYKEKKTMYVRFYYDGEASEELIELWHCAITEASASIGAECFVDDGVERLDYPCPIPLCGHYAYLRREFDSNIDFFTSSYALLQVQKSFLGIITPQLRCIVVDAWKETKSMYLRAYYDGEVPQKLIDLWGLAITKAALELDLNCVVDAQIERIDYPQKMPVRGRYAYARKELQEWERNKEADSDE